ncbi:MAG: regulatory iron-sulfur-containing complex subunit RicT [Desulfocapsaceae bacterium]|nr:regulatory iron-sulfur-containing complex subunit RicT [Desulfocapsaceae bacterium]
MSKQQDAKSVEQERTEEEQIFFYRIRFREKGQEFTASSELPDLKAQDAVMVKTDHGAEPAIIISRAPSCHGCEKNRRSSYALIRRANQEEMGRYGTIAIWEETAFKTCKLLIEQHKLPMRLVRAERYFNGSKIVFYFTANNRIDFRDLVKDLVLEFHTRVEMRQVGVRHETKMIGGLGTCGRELCCSVFMDTFDSVSIKMAKEQDLPLNPTKISGVCNRLLCCLTYEYSTYRRERKGMPKPGKRIRIGEDIFQVRRQHPLQQTILVSDSQGESHLLTKEQWQESEPVKVEESGKKDKK